MRPVTVRVVLVDDQPLVLHGFRLILSAEPDIDVVGEAGSGEQAVRVVAAVEPDVVLMDVRMSGMDGIEATRRIVGSGSTARVVILTTFDLDEYAFEALRVGASGFLLKDALPEELLAGVRAVASGDAVLAPTTTRRLLTSYAAGFGPTANGTLQAGAALDTLTQREREVFTGMAEGLTNAEIAARLLLSEATVKTHVGRVLLKLGLRDRVQAVIFAYERGLTRPRSAPGLPPDRTAPGG